MVNSESVLFKAIDHTFSDQFIMLLKCLQAYTLMYWPPKQYIKLTLKKKSIQERLTVFITKKTCSTKISRKEESKQHIKMIHSIS